MCNSDIDCLIDFVVTGDEAVAMATREGSENIQRVQAIQGI